MAEKDGDNPLEEIQKQLRQLLKGQNVQVAFAPFMKAAEAKLKEPDGDDDMEEDDPATEERLRTFREFNRKPKEIRDYLDRFVIKQEQAKRVLSVAVCDHYNHVRRCLENPDATPREYVKPNVLLLGPTGVGKTYLMRNVAKLIGVPFVKADATKFSETGYVGYDVEDIVRDLVKVANGDVQLAEHGIIYVDEIDKIASASSQGGKDVSGRGVQVNLLKLMEETEVNLHSAHDMMGQMQAIMEMQRGGGESGKRSISTRNVLFIVSGAFDQLAEDVKRRLDRNRIGFGPNEGGDEDMSRYLAMAETRDFMNYGFEPEFVGRLPVRVACTELLPADLAEILLSSEGNVLEQFRDDFKGYGIGFSMKDDVVHRVAELAYKENTGARGLVTVLERIFRDFKFELPSTAVTEFKVTPEVIDDPAVALEKLLEENVDLLDEAMLKDIDRFAEDFRQTYGFTLRFHKPAKQALAELAKESGRSVYAICERKFKDFEHGLQIICQRTGRDAFPIDKKVVENPDKELSSWVVDSFRGKEEDN
ncbi:MAG: ATP-dependent protease [Opitutales bacterium]|nr:ATP-dependent protease [Opitutales bacterium]